jgi:predicted Ser/Thr protein kinase
MNDKLIEVAGYTLHGQLGKGGMAEVFLATQNSLQRKVAIKVLNSAVDDEFSRRFINEGHVVASLHHASIVTIYDIDKLADGRHYLAMEFVAGGDLTQYKGQALTVERALSITQQIAEGLQVVHQQGLVHRDIKPANILFRKDGSVVITDFGVAKDLAIDNDLTQFGIAVGSPAYSSPEQAQCQPLDQRTDIYSLGVLLLEMLTGANDFRGPSYTQTVMNHVQMPIPQLPAHLTAYQPLLERMLAKDVNKRFASCRELLQSLALLQDDDLNVTQFSKAVSLAKPKSRAVSKVLALLLGAILLVGGAFAGYKINLSIKISDYLAQAEARLVEGKLQAPAQDNADYFFAQVLQLEPENMAAQAGLQRVIAARAAASISLGQLRVASMQLTNPLDDNALFYFQQALALTPDNQQARNGLQQIAEIYLEQANAAYASREFTRALENIQSGLLAEPEHPQLLKLASEHAAYVARATRPIAKPRPAAPRTAKNTPASKSQASKPAEDSSNPVSRLWDHILSNGMD